MQHPDDPEQGVPSCPQPPEGVRQRPGVPLYVACEQPPEQQSLFW